MLITLVSIHPYPSPQSIPLANAFLKAYTLESSASVDLVDFFLSQDATSCATELAGRNPDAIGFSMYAWNRVLICEIAAALRHSHPGITLFCGGPEVTADPESFTRMAIFDFVIVGEGEVPFLSLCHSLIHGEAYSAIPGVLMTGAPLLPPPKPLPNLDLIPSPYLTGVIDTYANRGILWQLSRGCSFTCDFCFDSRGTHGVRQFSLERLESEVRHFSATGVSQIFVLDSTFNFDKVRAKKILKMIKKYAPEIHFHFEVRCEFIDREMADLFAHIACSLQIGLQSADPAVLTLVGRSFIKADFSAKVGLLNKSGATFGFDLIYGLPGDTLVGFCNTVDYALSLYPNHLDIFPLAVLPGTRLATNGTALNITWDNQPPYLVTATDLFSTSDMAAAAVLATACDIFYTRGKAVAWFNSVCAVLAIKGSEVLQKFSIWLISNKGNGAKESDYSDGDIWKMQQVFLSHLFRDVKVKRFLPLVLDFINYHFHYSEVLLNPHSPRHADSQSLTEKGNSSFELASSTRIVLFTYEIIELLECGEPQIRWMYENLRQSGSQAVMYYNNGLVCTESLDSGYLHLLELIRDGGDFNCVSDTGLSSEETNEFLQFALQEGILVRS